MIMIHDDARAVEFTTNDGNFEVTRCSPKSRRSTTAASPQDPFTVTYKMNPDAVWDDGSPITSTDVEFTWKVELDTEGSLSTAGYDQIESIDTHRPGDRGRRRSRRTTPAYKNLFSH